MNSIPLKGDVRRKQVSNRHRLAIGCHGDSQEACIAPRGSSTLTYLACYVSQWSQKPGCDNGSMDRGGFTPSELPKITQVNLTYPVSTLGSRKERKGHPETRHLKYLACVSFVRTREAPPGMRRSMGRRRGANALRKADALIWNTDEGGVAEGT